MSESIVLNITAEGEVRITGYPPADAAHWELLARGLSGYYRANGLNRPGMEQQRIDAFHALIAKYGIDPNGIECGIVQ